MIHNDNCQSFDDRFWEDFAAEIDKSVEPKPLTPARRSMLAEIERELDALCLPEAGELPQLVATPRRQTLLERLKAAGNFASVPTGKTASNSGGKIASFSEPLKTQETHVAHTSFARGETVCPVRAKSPLPNTPISTPSKSWKHATQEQKLSRAVTVIGHAGYSLTLNLSDAQEEALRKSRDPARHLSDRINRALKEAGIEAPEYAFALEVSDKGRLHAHGAIVLPAHADRERIKQALMRAGGRIKGKAAARQVKLDPMPEPAGWASYCLKDLKLTRKALGTNKIAFLSTGLKRRCRD